MSQAETYITPSDPLDKLVARCATSEARKLTAAGHTKRQAAELSCPGSWREWRGYVLAALQHDDAHH